jgi:uncharacterized DUF497 family protein
VNDFDDDKSIVNLEKHGIDFLAAQELWDDLIFSSSLPKLTMSLDFLSSVVLQ